MCVDSRKEEAMENREKIQMAENQGEIVGAILCGHDGCTGCFYHVCVKEE